MSITADAQGAYAMCRRICSRYFLRAGSFRQSEGIDDTFADIVEIEKCCKFRDCHHNTEPGCAIKAAITDGSLSAERYELYRGLKSESERNFNRKAVAIKRRQINNGRRQK